VLGWQVEIADDEGDGGLCTSLALDSSDSPHASYHDWGAVPWNMGRRYGIDSERRWSTQNPEPMIALPSVWMKTIAHTSFITIGDVRIYGTRNATTRSRDACFAVRSPFIPPGSGRGGSRGYHSSRQVR
jgi:hypothetical protein